jgi:cytochrome c553
LLKGPSPTVPNLDAATQDCITCHNGGSNLTPTIPNIFGAYSKASAHPFPAGSNKHAANESAVLQKDRHATCVDCHNPHATQQTNNFASTTAFGERYSRRERLGWRH